MSLMNPNHHAFNEPQMCNNARKNSKTKTNIKPSNKNLSKKKRKKKKNLLTKTKKVDYRKMKAKDALRKNNAFRFEIREQCNLKLSRTLKRNQSGSNSEDSFSSKQNQSLIFSGGKQLQFWPSEFQLVKFSKNRRSLLRRHNDTYHHEEQQEI